MSGSRYRGDSEYQHDRGHDDRGGRSGGTPGKRALTDRLGSTDAATKLLGQIRDARSTVARAKEIAARMRSGQVRAPRGNDASAARGGNVGSWEADSSLMDAMGLPGMMGAAPTASAPSASADLSATLEHLGCVLDAARDAARVLGSAGGLEILNELAQERAALLAEAEPLHIEEQESQPSEEGPSSGEPGAEEAATVSAPDVATDLAASGAGDLGGDRGALEGAFGASLGDVRLHSDDRAAAHAHKLGARAFAVGNDVALPDAVRGSERAFILAHEIAHVVQQRGGTGGEMRDPELAADEAARAFVSGEPVPAQPGAARAVACFAGPAPGPVTVAPPAIGNQNAPQPGGQIDLYAAAKEAGVANDMAQLKAWLERPTPTTKHGGTAPTFVQSSGTTRILHATPRGETRVQRDIPISYEPRFFHVLDAILHDILRAKSLPQIDSLWTLYLRDKPRPAPWSFRREVERLREPQRSFGMPTCSKDGPGYWEVPDSETALPPGSAASQLWLVDFHFFPEDPDGGIRANVLTLAIFAKALDEEEPVPGLAPLVVPYLRRKREVDTLTDPAVEPDKVKIGTTLAADDGKKKDDVPTLTIPGVKAPHFATYQALARDGHLVAEGNYDRGRTDQRPKWRSFMKPGGANGIPDHVLERGLRILALGGWEQDVC